MVNKMASCGAGLQHSSVAVKALFSSFISLDQRNTADDDGALLQDSNEAKQPHTPKSSCTDLNQEIEEIVSEPRNKPAYFERIATFTARNWFAKPLNLSPMICARYGWRNIDVDLLRCVTCKAVLCAKLPSNSSCTVCHQLQERRALLVAGGNQIVWPDIWQVGPSSDYVEEFCDRLKDSLLTAHESLCPWSSNPSPEFFMTIQCCNKDDVLVDFHKRADSLQSLGDKLPSVNLQTFKEQKIFQEHWTHLIEAYMAIYCYIQNSAFLEKLLQIAACGWVKNTRQKDVLTCEYCQRNVGLWSFKNTNGNNSSKIPGEDNKEEDITPSKKQIKLSIKDAFDPVAEHRDWCPWVRIDENISECNHSYKSTYSAHSLVKTTVTSTTPADRHHHGTVTNCISQPSWAKVVLLFSSHSQKPIEEMERLKRGPPIEVVRYIRMLLNQCSSPKAAKNMH